MQLSRDLNLTLTSKSIILYFLSLEMLCKKFKHVFPGTGKSMIYGVCCSLTFKLGDYTTQQIGGIDRLNDGECY